MSPIVSNSITTSTTSTISQNIVKFKSANTATRPHLFYTNGKISDSCYEAARAAINGETNVGGATHFRRAGNHDGILIDNQVF